MLFARNSPVDLSHRVASVLNLRAVKYVQQPVISCYSGKNTLVTPTHNEIFMKDFSGSNREKKAWELDMFKVIKANDGKAYLELSDYHLILDIDYQKIVKLIKSFVSSFENYQVEDKNAVIRASYHKTLALTDHFLAEAHFMHTNLVDEVEKSKKLEFGTEKIYTSIVESFKAIDKLARDFKDKAVEFKHSFVQVSKDSENSDGEVQSYEVILSELDSFLQVFTTDLIDSCESGIYLADLLFNNILSMETIEKAVQEVYNSLSDMLTLAGLQTTPTSIKSVFYNLHLPASSSLPTLTPFNIQQPPAASQLFHALHTYYFNKMTSLKTHILQILDWSAYLHSRLHQEVVRPFIDPLGHPQRLGPNLEEPTSVLLKITDFLHTVKQSLALLP